MAESASAFVIGIYTYLLHYNNIWLYNVVASYTFVFPQEIELRITLRRPCTILIQSAHPVARLSLYVNHLLITIYPIFISSLHDGNQSGKSLSAQEAPPSFVIGRQGSTGCYRS